MSIVPVTVENIDTRTAWPSGQRRVSRLREYVAAGRVVWWRRQPPAPVHPPLPTHPKWHVFVGRSHVSNATDQYTFAWHALCGHEDVRSDVLADERSFTVVQPRKTFRCAECDDALRKLKHPTT
jgi:hypothetical protein